MTIKEALDYAFYNVNFQEPCSQEDEIKGQKAIKIITDMAEKFEKYEKALSYIYDYVHPVIVEYNNHYFWQAFFGRDFMMYSLPPEAAYILSKIFNENQKNGKKCQKGGIRLENHNSKQANKRTH